MKNKELQSGNGFLWILYLCLGFCTSVFLLANRRAEVVSADTLVSAMNGASTGALCLIGLFTLFYRHLAAIRQKRELGFAAAGGLVFALCSIAGFRIYHQDSLFPVPCNLFSLTLDLVCFLGAFALFTGILLLFFDFLRTHPIRQQNGSRLDQILGSSRKSFFLYFGLLMAVSIPLQIFFYPGLTNPDSFTQISESMGLQPLTDRHPFLHTLMMGLVIRLGRALFGTTARGVCFYTFFQSVLVSLTVSFTLTYMARRKIHPGLRLATLLYFLLHPAIACYSITLWKDIWLSYFLLLYVLLLTEAALNPELFFQKKSHTAGLLLVILGFLFTKNTGIAVLLGTLPVLLISCKKHWKKILPVAVLAFAVLGIVRFLVIPQLGIAKGRVVEPFSVPLQQMARTAVREGNSLTQQQKDTLNEIMPLDQLPQLYEPHLSDNVKLATKDGPLAQNPMRYVKCWLELGASHPRSYLESFLANSCGYWFPEVIYWVVEPSWYFDSGLLMNPGPQQDPDADSYQPDPAGYTRRHYFVHLYEMLQKTPGFSTLLSVAISFWWEFVLFLICLLKKNRRMLIPLMVPLIIWILCLFSPVIAEYRYAFPAVVTLPILTAFVLQDDIFLTEELSPEKKKKH